MIRKRPSWRVYQEKLHKPGGWTGRARRFGLLSLLALAAIWAMAGWLNVSCGHRKAGEDPSQRSRSAEMSRRHVRGLLADRQLFNLADDRFSIQRDGHRFLVQTSLNSPLQQYLLERLDRKNSRTVAIVLLEPGTGRVLALAGHNKADPLLNPCLQSTHPAASLFKIVTASAAVETCGFDARTRLAYNGRKYTLYKSQLKKSHNRYTHYVNLKDSFAQSINPVFGKIGVHYLQRKSLEQYAARFGFNEPLDFELPLAPSVARLTDEPYQWAEVASGFNRNTRISPLHGALLGATILNDGMQPAPTAIDRIFDADGNVVYRGQPCNARRAVTPAAAGIMKELMRATVQSGTCRKVFRNYRRDPVLKQLDIGGKTGSIGTDEAGIRYDWFVGFAENENGAGLAVGAMVVHEKYIGIRAGTYARMALKEYFSRYAIEKTTQI